MCKKRAIKTGKAEDVTENDKKVILCNFLETTWNDNDCFLNILIGPKVADTTFTLKILIFLDQIYPKRIFSVENREMNITTVLRIFKLVSVPNFSLNWQFCFFGPDLPKKGISGWRQTKWAPPLILHIWISWGTKFQLKPTILNFWTKFA